MLPQLEEIASECRINTIVFMRIVEQISQFGGEESILIDEAFINVEPALKAAAEKYLNSVANRLALKRVSMETKLYSGRLLKALLIMPSNMTSVLFLLQPMVVPE